MQKPVISNKVFSKYLLTILVIVALSQILTAGILRVYNHDVFVPDDLKLYQKYCNVDLENNVEYSITSLVKNNFFLNLKVNNTYIWSFYLKKDNEYVQHGLSIEFDSLNRTSYIGEYTHGKKSGFWVYVVNRKVSSIKEYKSGKVRLFEGLCYGNSISISEKDEKTGQYCGQAIKCSKRGTLDKIENYSNGYKSGRCYYLHHDLLQSIGSYQKEYYYTDVITLRLVDSRGKEANKNMADKFLENFKSTSEEVFHPKNDEWVTFNRRGITKIEIFKKGTLLETIEIERYSGVQRR